MKALYTIVIYDTTCKYLDDIAWINDCQLDKEGAININNPQKIFEYKNEAEALLYRAQKFAQDNNWDWAKFYIDEI